MNETELGSILEKGNNQPRFSKDDTTFEDKYAAYKSTNADSSYK
jgi:hypothetical protein